jgi:hypothetical protein
MKDEFTIKFTRAGDQWRAALYSPKGCAYSAGKTPEQAFENLMTTRRAGMRAVEALESTGDLPTETIAPQETKVVKTERSLRLVKPPKDDA